MDIGRVLFKTDPGHVNGIISDGCEWALCASWEHRFLFKADGGNRGCYGFSETGIPGNSGVTKDLGRLFVIWPRGTARIGTVESRAACVGRRFTATYSGLNWGMRLGLVDSPTDGPGLGRSRMAAWNGVFERVYTGGCIAARRVPIKKYEVNVQRS